MMARIYPEETVALFNEGNSVIIVDDHCYVVKNWNGDKWGNSSWLFKEAILEIRNLPIDPDQAVRIDESLHNAELKLIIDRNKK